MTTTSMIHVAKTQLGLDEDIYRALLARVTGVASLRAMSESQRIAVVDELKRLGFRVKSSGRTLPMSSKAYIRQIHTLWKSCHHLGVIADGSRPALRRFCRGILFPGDTKIAVDPDTLDYAGASKVIDALKAMEKRGKARVAL